MPLFCYNRFCFFFFRDPNYPHSFSSKLTRSVSIWPMFLPHANSDNYKEFTVSLPNRKGLKKAECSFWSDYIETLKESTGKQTIFCHFVRDKVSS